MVLLLVATGCASARPDLRDPYHVAAIGTAAADVGTTYYGLKQPGIEEANPAATAICGEKMNAGCMIALKAGMISLTAYMENEYKLEGWRKRLIWLLPISLWGGAAVWNATVIW